MADVGHVGRDLCLVAEEELGRATIGGGAVAPTGVAVSRPEGTSFGVQLLAVRAGVAFDVGSVDCHGGAALVGRRKARLDKQRQELVQSQRDVRTVLGAGRDLAGVLIDLHVVVVVDQGSR